MANFTNLDDKEFDSLLEDIVDTPPSSNLSHDITPWNYSFKNIVLGLGLTSLTLNFLCLDIILPCIGYILMFLGFRSLRNENKWFKAGYFITIIRLMYWLISLLFCCSVYFKAIEKTVVYQIIFHICVFLSAVLFIVVRNAIRSVQTKVGLTPHGGNGIVIYFSIIMLMGYIGVSSFIVWVLPIAYIFALRALYKLSEELDRAGYAIHTTPVKISDNTIKICYTCAVLCIMIVSYLFLNKYPMDWQLRTENVAAETSELRQELLDLGFPKYVLDDMTNEEILSCNGVEKVLIRLETHFLEDNSTLNLTFVGLKYADEREHWKIIHYFEWYDTNNFCGTEAIQFWPTDHSDGWYVSTDLTGRVLYDDYDGKTYISDYYSLEPYTYQSNSLIWGESVETDIFATFSMPSKSTRQRGYVMYDALENMDGAMIDSRFNYAHQMNQFQFPVRDGVEFIINSFGSDYSFTQIQTALQIFTHKEEPELAE